MGLLALSLHPTKTTTLSYIFQLFASSLLSFFAPDFTHAHPLSSQSLFSTFYAIVVSFYSRFVSPTSQLEAYSLRR